jgi:V8-like Glu-specific endopeptidase
MPSKCKVTSFLLFVFLALIASVHGQCGTLPKASGLSYGSKVSEHDNWPWLGAMFNIEKQKFFCASTLISQQHALTAAHCFLNKREATPLSPGDVIVYFNKHNLSIVHDYGSVKADVTDILIHPDWKPFETFYDADIAVIKLSADVAANWNIVQVCLWPKMEFGVDEGTVVGW